jgi:hypothetical protein
MPRQKTLSLDDLINAESALGRTIFGPVGEGHQREFFHHQKNVWIWHEAGVTVRYEVRPHGVFKKLLGHHYIKIEGAELQNFLDATRQYLKLVKSHLYGAP